MPTITVTRESTYADRVRNYLVVLDDEEIGGIADGQTSSFVVEPGNRTLHLKIDWARSNKVSFDIGKEETASFKCASRVRGVQIILAIMYATILPHKYIKLERIHRDAE